MSKRLAGIIGGKDKISLWHLNGFPDGSNRYSYINRHAGTKKKKYRYIIT